MPQTELTPGVGFWKTTFLGKYTQKLLNGISSRITTLISDMGLTKTQVSNLSWSSSNSTDTVSGTLVNKLYNEIDKSYIPTNIYGVSSTAAATVQKTVSIPSIKQLNTGQIIIVKPTITSTVANMTIKLNSFDAKLIKYAGVNNTTSTDIVVWSENIPSMFVYDGTYWQFLGHGYDTNTNTTYALMPQTEINGGTATTARSMSAKLLRDNFYTEDEIELQNSILNTESQKRIFKEHNPKFEYFTIESLDDNNTIILELVNDDSCRIQVNTILFGDSTLEQFSNRWEELRPDSSTNIVTLNTGDKVMFRSVTRMNNFSNLSFSTTSRFKVYGNILSLGNETVSGKIFVDDNSFNIGDKTGIFVNLFMNCTYLVDAENLILPDYVTESCYKGMFNNCESLIKAPKLPATTLSNGCYYRMFGGCSSLVNAPELPAKILKPGCYQKMFVRCLNLKYVKMLAINITPNNCDDFMYHMFGDIETTDGIFIKDDSLIVYDPYYANNCIPTWTIKNYDTYIEQYLTFEAIEPNTQIHFVYSGNYTTTNPIEYSLDFGETWTISGNNPDNPPFPQLVIGQKILVRSTNACYRSDRSNNRCYFVILSGKVNIYGNIMSMIHGDDFINDNTLTEPYALSGLFCIDPANSIFNISNLILSATTLTPYCYYQMFANCQYITMPPKIFARTLAEGCCKEMFMTCTHLLYAPTLYAKILPSACYAAMFANCTSLCYVKLDVNNNVNNSNNHWLNGTSKYGILIISDATVYDNINREVPDNWKVKVLANYNDENNYDYDQIVHGVLFEQFEDLENNVSTNISDNITNIQNSLLNLPKDYSEQYLTIESTGSSNTIKWKHNGSGGAKTIYISTNNGKSWTSKTSSSTGISLATLSTNQKMLIKGSNASNTDSTGNYYSYFTSTNQFNVYGNIMSLIKSDNFCGTTLTDGTNKNAFSYLFNYANVRNAQNLILPKNTTYGCYAKMFANCSNLFNAPELPATILSTYCYEKMFYNCDSLMYAPTLRVNGFTLTSNVGYSCAYMFAECHKLNSVTCLFDDLTSYCINNINGNVNDYTYNMTYNWTFNSSDNDDYGLFVTSTIKFPTDDPEYGIPENWAVRYEQISKDDINTLIEDKVNEILDSRFNII